jgi:CheY-like chemotaxis protein
MPGKNGVELCTAIHERQGESIPAILLTARDGELCDADRTRGNILEVINKPFSPRAVCEAVGRLLAA